MLLIRFNTEEWLPLLVASYVKKAHSNYGKASRLRCIATLFIGIPKHTAAYNNLYFCDASVSWPENKRINHILLAVSVVFELPSMTE